MSKLNLEDISDYVANISKDLDKQFSDHLYVILELGRCDVESNEVTEEIIKELKKNYVVNYCVAKTSEINHYILVVTPDSYVSLYSVERPVLDLLYKDITDKVDEVTEEGRYYYCNILIYSTLNLNLVRGILYKLREYEESYNLHVDLECEHGDNPRNLKVYWDKNWVIDHHIVKLKEFHRQNAPKHQVSDIDLAYMYGGEYIILRR
nr:MAG TPA: hypothetical protein [Caudoviricetes sp.]